jgi:hypothetical protein
VPPITVAISTAPERIMPTLSVDTNSTLISPKVPAMPAKKADITTTP